MANSKSVNLQRKTIDKILTAFGVIATITLFAIGGLSWWAYSFTASQVGTELASQKIYFPAKGNPALASNDIGPYLDQYAGQQLTTGTQAQAYANHFIAVHLKEIGGGKTYAELSTEAQADPSNATLQTQVATLFKGETLRGMLLNAYAFWTIGMIAQIAAIVAFVAGGIMAVLTLLGFWHVARG